MRLYRAARWFWGSLAIVAVAFGAWFYSHQPTPLPRKSYRIGFEENPPYHFRHPDGSPGGIAYEVVSEAAQRAGIQLEWVHRQESSEAALRSGQVDLWPLVTDLPERREFLYISRPWLQTDHFLVIRGGKPGLTSFTGEWAVAACRFMHVSSGNTFQARSIPLPSHLQLSEQFARGNSKSDSRARYRH
jgi:ABC-type amino acid transport substrate-binding protein